MSTIASYLLIIAATTTASALGTFILMCRRDSIRKAKAAAEAEQQRLRDEALVQGVSLATTSLLRSLLQANLIGAASSNAPGDGSAMSASHASLRPCDERADRLGQQWGKGLRYGSSLGSDRRRCVSTAKSRVLALAGRLLSRGGKR